MAMRALVVLMLARDVVSLRHWPSVLTRGTRLSAQGSGTRMLFGLGRPPPPQAEVTSRCFLDVCVLSPAGDSKFEVGRLELSLFENDAPLSCARFRALCSGEGGASYKGSTFHRTLREFIVQGGKLDEAVEPFVEAANGLRHIEGALSMSNDGGSSTSEFFVTLREAPELDGDFCVFGQVSGGMKEVVRDIDRRAGSVDGEPWCTYVITGGGVL